MAKFKVGDVAEHKTIASTIEIAEVRDRDYKIKIHSGAYQYYTIAHMDERYNLHYTNIKNTLVARKMNPGYEESEKVGYIKVKA